MGMMDDSRGGYDDDDVMIVMNYDCFVCSRQRESGDSPYAVKLSLDELEGFYRQIYTLPCRISEQSVVSVSFSFLSFM